MVKVLHAHCTRRCDVNWHDRYPSRRAGCAGLVPNLAGIIPEKALKLGINDILVHHLRQSFVQKELNFSWPRWLPRWWIGCAAQGEM